MCRNIKPLFNYLPPATDKDIRDASLQFVRKISGFREPSQANEKTFNHAVNKISVVVDQLLDSLVTSAKKRDRKAEETTARKKAIERFGK